MLFLIVVAYANSLNGPFMFDDREAILDNPSIRTLWPPAVLFPERDLPVSGRPFANLSLAMNYAWSGLDVFSHHLVNLTIHCLSALVLFGIVRRTLELPSIAEAFRRRSQRTELLLGLCYLLTIYGSLRAATLRQACSADAERWIPRQS